LSDNKADNGHFNSPSISLGKAGVHMAEVLPISTTSRKQIVDLTDRIEAVIRRAKMQDLGRPAVNAPIQAG
jgi:hypothetical protein